MGDIRCSKCGEPWDAECIHEEISERVRLGNGSTASIGGKVYRGLRSPYPERRDPWDTTPRGAAPTAEARERYSKAYAKAYDAMRVEFRARGCAAFEAFSGGSAACSGEPILSADGLALVGLADELAGDGVDGLVSDLEDAQALGLFS